MAPSWFLVSFVFQHESVGCHEGATHSIVRRWFSAITGAVTALIRIPRVYNLIVGAGFQPALQFSWGSFVDPTKSVDLRATRNPLSSAMAICAYLRYLRFFRPTCQIRFQRGYVDHLFPRLWVSCDARWPELSVSICVIGGLPR